MKKWKICKECGTMFHPCSTINVYCSRECAKKAQYEYAKKYNIEHYEKHLEHTRKYNKKNPRHEHHAFYEELTRYKLHRLRIFSHFYNKEKGIGTR